MFLELTLSRGANGWLRCGRRPKADDESQRFQPFVTNSRKVFAVAIDLDRDGGAVSNVSSSASHVSCVSQSRMTIHGMPSQWSCRSWNSSACDQKHQCGNQGDSSEECCGVVAGDEFRDHFQTPIRQAMRLTSSHVMNCQHFADPYWKTSIFYVVVTSSVSRGALRAAAG